MKIKKKIEFYKEKLTDSKFNPDLYNPSTLNAGYNPKQNYNDRLEKNLFSISTKLTIRKNMNATILTKKIRDGD